MAHMYGKPWTKYAEKWKSNKIAGKRKWKKKKHENSRSVCQKIRCRIKFTIFSRLKWMIKATLMVCVYVYAICITSMMMMIL